MEESQELALSNTKKFVEKLGSSIEENEDSTLMRFLIAKSMDPEKAAKLFVQWKKLRSTLAPLGYVPESEITDQLEAKMIYLQLFSKKGFPIVVIKMCKHSPSKDQTKYKMVVTQTIRDGHTIPLWKTWDGSRPGIDGHTIPVISAVDITVISAVDMNGSHRRCGRDVAGRELMVHFLDKAIASFINGTEQGNEKLIIIGDLKDIAFKNVDVGAMISGFQIMQDYYLDRVSKIYILYMPGFFVTFWKIISRFLDKALLEKIVIVKSEDGRKEFIEEIGEEALPEEYGGQSQLVPIQDVIIPPPLSAATTGWN